VKIDRTSLLSLGLVVASFAAAVALYDRLPDLVPTHWNAAGQADGFTPKPWGPFVLPLVMAGAWLLFTVLPRISPRGYRLEKFQRPFEIVQVTLLAFLLGVTLIALIAGIGVPVPMEKAIGVGTGLLFIVLGNFMGKFTKNFFIGIRTPWTLASDEVWLRTHRLAGKLFVLAGVILIVSGLMGGGELATLLVVPLAAGIPILYSYVLYRRLEGFKNGSSDDQTSHPSP
jgi:uncharacterized membrane protein